MRRRQSRRSLVAVVLLVAFALIGAACGGSSDSGDSAGPTTTADPNKAEEIQENKAEGEDARADEADTPVPGGKLVYGIEADSANPWVHYATSCAISCRMIFRAITDSLFVSVKKGEGAEMAPYLLSAAEHSADYKEWTFTARDGVTFHDGTPFDGEAIRYNVDVCRLSGLTGPSLSHIESTSASGQDAVIKLKTPDVAFPVLFREEVCGMMFSPTWMASLESNPLRKADAARVTEPTGKQSEPVGLGAFKFKSYTPGNGNSFVAVKNPDYWRADEGLPYLDEVEFVVAVDIQSRSNGLRGGQFSIIHSANSDEGKKFDDDVKDDPAKWALLQANAFGETSHYMINVAEGTNAAYAALSGKDGTMDPEGKNASSPMLNVHCRLALAFGKDAQEFVKLREAGQTRPANGPFPPGSIGFLEDSGFPIEQDVDRANDEMDQCLSELGTDKITFTFNITNDPFNVESNQLTASQWKKVFGDKIDTSVTPIEQGQYIGVALVGDYNVFGWRNFAAIDPNELVYWWSSSTASPIGVLALNFGRFQDKVIDDNLGILRTNPDPAARQKAAQAINRQFAEQAYNLWNYWTLWTVAANPKVRNLTDLPLPEGVDGEVVPVIAGKHHLSQIWCEEGDCG